MSNNHKQQLSQEQITQVNRFALLAVLDKRKYDADHLSNLNEHLVTHISAAAWKDFCDSFQRALEKSIACNLFRLFV
jgi:hypothetical protein